jgi:glycosyltransferase involved in cell wall biosynthesis
LVRSLSTGTLTLTNELLSALEGLGSDVLVVHLGRKVPELPFRVMTVAARPALLPGPVEATQPLRFIAATAELKRIVADFQPDLFLAQGLDELCQVAVLSTAVYHRPSLTFVHDLTVRELSLSGAGGRLSGVAVAAAKLRQRLNGRFMRHIVVGSDLMKRSLVLDLGLRAEVVPLGVSSDFRPGAQKPGKTPFHLVYVGVLSKKKNVDAILNALPLLRDLALDLTVVGHGPLMSSLSRKAADLGVSDRVSFTGSLSRPDLVGVLQRSHLCVMPSLWEGFGLAALEAMACGVPVIVSTTAGVSEVVAARQTGLVLESMDEGLLATSIRRLHDDDALWSTASANAEAAARDFTWFNTASRLLAVARKALPSD